MVKSNFEIDGKMGKTNVEIKGPTTKIILELALILIRIKSEDNGVYLDILKTIEIINNSMDKGINVDELQDMFICEYSRSLKKKGK